LSVDAQNVLERMGVHSLRELLSVDRVKFRYLSSVADKTRKEIRNVAKRPCATASRPLTPGGVTVHAEAQAGARIASVDELASTLLRLAARSAMTAPRNAPSRCTSASKKPQICRAGAHRSARPRARRRHRPHPRG